MAERLQSLYSTLSQDYDLGSFDEFSVKMRDSTKRRALYDAASNDYDLGDFATFEAKLAPEIAPAPSRPPLLIPPELLEFRTSAEPASTAVNIQPDELRQQSVLERYWKGEFSVPEAVEGTLPQKMKKLGKNALKNADPIMFMKQMAESLAEHPIETVAGLVTFPLEGMANLMNAAQLNPILQYYQAFGNDAQREAARRIVEESQKMILERPLDPIFAASMGKGMLRRPTVKAKPAPGLSPEVRAFETRRTPAPPEPTLGPEVRTTETGQKVEVRPAAAPVQAEPVVDAGAARSQRLAEMGKILAGKEETKPTPKAKKQAAKAPAPVAKAAPPPPAKPAEAAKTVMVDWPGSLTDDAVEAIIERVGGKIEITDGWGTRKVSIPVERKSEWESVLAKVEEVSEEGAEAAPARPVPRETPAPAPPPAKEPARYRSFDKPEDAIGDDKSSSSAPFQYGGAYEIEFTPSRQQALTPHRKSESRGKILPNDVTKVYVEPYYWGPEIRNEQLRKDVSKLRELFPKAEIIAVKRLPDDPDTPVVIGAYGSDEFRRNFPDVKVETPKAKGGGAAPPVATPKRETARQKAEREDAEFREDVTRMLEKNPEGFYLSPKIGGSLVVKSLGGEPVPGKLNYYRKATPPVAESERLASLVRSGMTLDKFKGEVAKGSPGEYSRRLREMAGGKKPPSDIIRQFYDKYSQKEQPSPSEVREMAQKTAKDARRARLKDLGKKALGLDETLGIKAGLSDKELIQLRTDLIEEAKYVAVKTYGEFKEWVEKEYGKFGDDIILPAWKEYEKTKALPGTTSMTKAAIAEKREAMGLEPLEQPEPFTRPERQAAAKKIVSQGVKLLKESEKGKILNATEGEAVKSFLAGLEADVDKAIRSGDMKAHRIAQDRFDKYSQIWRGAQTEAGRAVEAFKGEVDYSAAGLVQRLEEAAQRKLSEEEVKKAAKKADEYKQASKEFDEVEREVKEREGQDLSAEAEEAVRKEAARQQSAAKRAVKREKVQAELDDLNKQFAQFAHRFNDVTSVPEATMLLGKIIYKHVELGAIDLADVVSRIRKDFPNVPESEIYKAATVRSGKVLDATKKEINRRSYAVRSEARLINTLSALKGHAEKLGETLSALKKLRIELRKGQYTKEEYRKFVKLVDEAEKVVSETMEGRKAKVKDPEAIGRVNKALDAVINASKTPERLADFMEQLRTGDYRIAVIKPRFKIDPELEQAAIRKDRLRSDIDHMLYTLRKKGWKDKALDVYNISRSLITAGDVGGLFYNARVFAYSHPIEAARVFSKSFKAYYDTHTAQEMMAYVQNRPGFAKGKEAGLDLTVFGKPGDLKAEEMFRSYMAENIPVAGKLVRAGERNYVTAMNLIRATIFDKYAEGIKDPAELKALAHMVNTFTGRGEWGKRSKVLSQVFFAPRRTLSKIEGYALLGKYRQYPAVRNLIAKDVAKSLAVTASLAALSTMFMGIEWNGNPNSPDFMKGRQGNKVWDFFTGETTILRTIFRLMLKARIWKQKQNDPGAKIDWTAIMKDTEGYGGRHEFATTNAKDDIVNFVLNKVHPSLSMGYKLVTSKDFGGREVSDLEVAGDLAPIFLQDAYEAWQDGNLLDATIVGGLSATGMANPQIYPRRLSESIGLDKNKEVKEELSRRVKQLSGEGKTRKEILTALKTQISSTAPYPLSIDTRHELLPPADWDFAEEVMTRWEEKRKTANELLNDAVAEYFAPSKSSANYHQALDSLKTLNRIEGRRKSSRSISRLYR